MKIDVRAVPCILCFSDAFSPQAKHQCLFCAGLTARFLTLQAAGVIHTDFEKGFIRAETIAYDDYVKHKGYTGAKESGTLRLEGKEYIVNEGDVMLFRFNV